MCFCALGSRLYTKCLSATQWAYSQWLSPTETSHAYPLYMCGGECVCRAPPSAWICMFWFSQDVSGWGVGVFPPANDGTQVRLRMDKTKPMDAIQTAEHSRYGHKSEEKEIREAIDIHSVLLKNLCWGNKTSVRRLYHWQSGWIALCPLHSDLFFSRDVF